MIPFGEMYSILLCDSFITCIIVVVINKKEIALIRQNCVSEHNYVCVVVVMIIRESAEETVVREVKEEIDHRVKFLEYVGDYSYEKIY